MATSRTAIEKSDSLVEIVLSCFQRYMKKATAKSGQSSYFFFVDV